MDFSTTILNELTELIIAEYFPTANQSELTQRVMDEIVKEHLNEVATNGQLRLEAEHLAKKINRSVAAERFVRFVKTIDEDKEYVKRFEEDLKEVQRGTY